MIGKNIRKLRDTLGLSQEKLGSAVGLSRPTVSQIESGARKVSAEELPAFSRALNASLEQVLGTAPFPSVSIMSEPHAHYGAKRASEAARISVPRENLDKFRQVLLYVLARVGAKPGIGEASLYKLLYFADFDFYEKYEEQLIGATYIKNNYGPTPVEFAALVKSMTEKGDVEKVKSGYFSFPRTKYLPLKAPDLSPLSAREIYMIDSVLGRLSDMGAEELAGYSHRDVPWLTAKEGQKLDYESVFYRTPEYSAGTYAGAIKKHGRN